MSIIRHHACYRLTYPAMVCLLYVTNGRIGTMLRYIYEDGSFWANPYSEFAITREHWGV